jgi:hypothetical protein
LTNDPGTGKVRAGKIDIQGTVTREDVAGVIDAVLANGQVNGWIDVLGNDSGERKVSPIKDEIEKFVKDGIDNFEGEDVSSLGKEAIWEEK